MLELARRVLYFLSFVMAISMNLKTVFLMEKDVKSFEFWTITISLSCTSLTSLYLVVFMITKFFRLPHSPTPFLSKVYVPFTLSCALRLNLDLDKDQTTQQLFCYSYCLLLLLFVCLEIISHFTRRWRLTEPIDWWTYKFLLLNFYSCEGAYKKCVRVLDTLGSLTALSGLLLGIFSLLCDQYDLEFELEGELKDVQDSLESYKNGLDKFSSDLESVYKQLNFSITCSDIYKVWAGGAMATFVFSIIPGRKYTLK